MSSGQKSGQKSGQDRAEHVSQMEPLLIGEGSRYRAELADLTVDLAAKSARFKASLPPGLVGPLSDAVRAMNCYYSNLIEGHDTHPVDIERALKDDYSRDPRKRDLQLEARAHIVVQQWIDEGILEDRAFSVGAAREVHQRFCALLPEEICRGSSTPTAAKGSKSNPASFERAT